MRLRIMESYILEALALFQYLTSAQLNGILPKTSITTVNRYLRDLREASKPLIRCLHFGYSPGKGPLAPVYCLTDRGAKWLTQHRSYTASEIKRPLGRSCFFAADYSHRIATIDFKISFLKRIKQQGYQLNFFHCYFEREGSNHSLSGATSKSKAALSSEEVQIIPDAIVGYVTPFGTEIVMFEQHMGKDAQRAVKQIMWHCRLLSKGIVNKKYGTKKNSHVVYVFEELSCMESVKSRLRDVSGFDAFQPYFRFRTMADSEQSLMLC